MAEDISATTGVPDTTAMDACGNLATFPIATRVRVLAQECYTAAMPFGSHFFRDAAMHGVLAISNTIWCKAKISALRSASCNSGIVISKYYHLACSGSWYPDTRA